MRDDGPGSRRRGSPARDASGDGARSRTLPRKEVAAMKRYTAILERDESGSWLARIPSVRGCHTHGRTLEQARRRLREALGLWVDDADTAELVEDIRLPARVLAAL